MHYLIIASYFIQFIISDLTPYNPNSSFFSSSSSTFPRCPSSSSPPLLHIIFPHPHPSSSVARHSQLLRSPSPQTPHSPFSFFIHPSNSNPSPSTSLSTILLFLHPLTQASRAFFWGGNKSTSERKSFLCSVLFFFFFRFLSLWWNVIFCLIVFISGMVWFNCFWNTWLLHHFF